MAEEKLNMKDLERRMQGAIDSLRHEFAGLRSGRATTSLLDPVNVEVYGAVMPISQVGTLSVPEPRMLSVQVWDKNNVSSVEKAIRNAGLGLNPMVDGTTVRVPVPQLTEERRKEMVKVAHKYAEQGRVAIRNVRRDGMDTIKKMEKDKTISEDEAKQEGEKVQKLTDRYVADVDRMASEKEQEIMQV
ncbi:ribosome recycling factor [Yunchengibacter salinarum]|uniref:ribosome recycling factor n=1 Tax=Yunchengibacter salinarum TaxID=3133399 RepID=UPI0035B67F21